MTDNATPAEPTAEEIAAAQAVLARKAEADAARIEAAKAPLREFAATPEFVTVLEQAQALRTGLPEGTPLHAHLNAMLIGMTNLQGDLA